MFKLIFFFIFFIFLNLKYLYAEVIYEKNNFIITNYELETFKSIYYDIYQKKISDREAIKNIILMSNLVDHIKYNNPQYLNDLDLKIKNSVDQKILEDQIKNNLIRFVNIRNEFIFDYFNQNLKESDVLNALANISKISLPLSKSNCLIIDLILHDYDTNKLAKIYFKGVRDNNFNFMISYENINYQICFDKETINLIESSLFSEIELITNSNFNNFLYETFKEKNK